MRMRKLALGQSVLILCASEEVHREIMLHSGNAADTAIYVAEVLLWSISNTRDYTRNACHFGQCKD